MAVAVSDMSSYGGIAVTVCDCVDACVQGPAGSGISGREALYRTVRYCRHLSTVILSRGLNAFRQLCPVLVLLALSCCATIVAGYGASAFQQQQQQHQHVFVPQAHSPFSHVCRGSGLSSTNAFLNFSATLLRCRYK